MSMSDDPDYDPYADWIPPAKVYMDDIPVLDPELGKVTTVESRRCGATSRNPDGGHRDASQRQDARR